MATRPTPAVVEDWQDVPAQHAAAKEPDDWQDVKDWEPVGDNHSAHDPGFLKGVWDNTVGGLVNTVKHYGVDNPAADQVQLSEQLQNGNYGGAAVTAAHQAIPGLDLVKDIYNSSADQVGQAADAFKKGDYSRAALHAYGAIPLIGPPVAEAAENIANPATRRYGMGQAVGAAASLLAPKAAGKIGEATQGLPTRVAEAASGINKLTPEQLVVKGLRGSVPSGRTNFYQNLSTSLPAIKAVEPLLEKPVETLDDLIGTTQQPGAIQLAKRANREEMDQLRLPLKNSQINLSPVADAIESSISDKTRLENPGEAARIKAIADKYRTSFPVDTVDSLLRSTNAELNSYYGKNPAARSVAAAANPDTAMLDAQAQALRDTFYKHLDAPQGGAAARQLQREYGALSELEDALQKRKNIALRQAPDSLSEQVAKWSGLGDALHAGGKLLSGNIIGATSDVLSGLGKAKMAKWLKDQQTTDSLIKRAFANHTEPRIGPHFPPPQKPVQPAGLLGSGPIVTPAPADSSGWVHGAEPRMGMGMSPNVEPEGAPPKMIRGASPGMPEPIEPTVPEGSIIRHTLYPSVRMIFKDGQWHPL